MRVLSGTLNPVFMGIAETIDGRPGASRPEGRSAVGGKTMRDTLILVSMTLAQFVVVVGALLV